SKDGATPKKPRVMLRDATNAFAERHGDFRFITGFEGWVTGADGTTSWVQVDYVDDSDDDEEDGYGLIDQRFINKVTALNADNLAATVKATYPGITHEELSAFKARVNFLKRNAKDHRGKSLDTLYEFYRDNHFKYGEDGQLTELWRDF